MLRKLLSLLSVCASLSLPIQAHAATEAEARQFVDALGSKVIAVLDSSADQAAKQQQLRQLFSDNVDIDWMGRFVLGVGWQKATEDQRSAYLKAYREYLLARYTSNFSDYTGSKYTVTGVKSEETGQFTVGMQIKTKKADEQNVQAGYRVKAADGGGLKVIDIIIEGVSLLTTQRSEFNSVVQKDGIDKLIVQLNAKAAAP
jgi:phospholipid transport system substrate-binding protein